MDSFWALFASAAGLGVLHTLAGPEHYLPFAAIAKARGWTPLRASMAALACGAGHLLSSLAIAAVGVLVGAGVGIFKDVDPIRGDVGKWIFLLFSILYFAYGIFKGISKNRRRSRGSFTAFDKASFGMLFVVFALGPCEILIPLVMYPASHFDWVAVLFITLAFTISTLATMAACVALLSAGLKSFETEKLELWGEALAGAVLIVCSGIMFA